MHSRWCQCGGRPAKGVGPAVVVVSRRASACGARPTSARLVLRPLGAVDGARPTTAPTGGGPASVRRPSAGPGPSGAVPSARARAFGAGGPAPPRCSRRQLPRVTAPASARPGHDRRHPGGPGREAVPEPPTRGCGPGGGRHQPAPRSGCGAMRPTVAAKAYGEMKPGRDGPQRGHGNAREPTPTLRTPRRPRSADAGCPPQPEPGRAATAAS